jgi:hypothetical protein
MSESQAPSAARQDSSPNEIWAAVLASAEGKPAAIGFLVTDGARLPKLLAYVEGGTKAALVTAMLIREGISSPESATDLRGDRIPTWLWGALLIPADAALPQNPEDRPFAAAMFRPDGNGRVGAFIVLTYASMDEFKKRILEKAQVSESGAQ